MTIRAAAILALAGACGSAPAPPLERAGDDRDDGAGQLARASVQLVIDGSGDSGGAADSPTAPPDDELGGTGYATWTPPSWRKQVAHPSHYAVALAPFDGGIAGTVTWSGAVPSALAAAGGCGAGLRLGRDRAVRGALVYIEHVGTGPAFPSYTHAAAVGGTVVKRGCALRPVAQIVSPVPAAVALYGDATTAQLRVTPIGPGGGAGSAAPLELQAGAFVAIELGAGVTRLDSADGSVAPAWVVGVETPFAALTDDAGHYHLDGVAPGVYDVTFFQAPPTAGGAPIIAHRKVKVGTDAVHLDVSLR